MVYYTPEFAETTDDIEGYFKYIMKITNTGIYPKHILKNIFLRSSLFLQVLNKVTFLLLFRYIVMNKHHSLKKKLASKTIWKSLHK